MDSAVAQQCEQGCHVGLEFFQVHRPAGGDAVEKRAARFNRKHDAEGIAPSTEVIRKFLPKDKPALILMDELLNYLNRERNRKTGLGGQLYSFVQNLSEEARAQDRVVLAVSLPSIVDEMTPEDE